MQSLLCGSYVSIPLKMPMCVVYCLVSCTRYVAQHSMLKFQHTSSTCINHLLYLTLFVQHFNKGMLVVVSAVSVKMLLMFIICSFHVSCSVLVVVVCCTHTVVCACFNLTCIMYLFFLRCRKVTTTYENLFKCLALLTLSCK